MLWGFEKSKYNRIACESESLLIPLRKNTILERKFLLEEFYDLKIFQKSTNNYAKWAKNGGKPWNTHNKLEISQKSEKEEKIENPSSKLCGTSKHWAAYTHIDCVRILCSKAKHVPCECLDIVCECRCGEVKKVVPCFPSIHSHSLDGWFAQIVAYCLHYVFFPLRQQDVRHSVNHKKLLFISQNA